jgi:hypothetical protein
MNQSVIVSGVLGTLLAHLLIRWLGRWSPVGGKPHPYSWYRARYGWMELLANLFMLTGMGVGICLYCVPPRLPASDPRGAAVGFFLACVIPILFLLLWCALSPGHRFREYWDFEELKYGAKARLVFYFMLPIFAVSSYGTVHLLIAGR